MYRTLALALLTAAGFSGVMFPAQAAIPAHPADTMAACFDTGDSKDINDNTDAIAAELNDHGYKVSGVEEWGSCVRAYVTDSHGRTGMELFDPDTLKPISGSMG